MVQQQEEQPEAGAEALLDLATARDAFTAFYDEKFQWTVRHFLNLTYSEELANDLAEEVFANLYSRYVKGPVDDAARAAAFPRCRASLFKACHNEWVDWLKKKDNHVASLDQMEERRGQQADSYGDETVLRSKSTFQEDTIVRWVDLQACWGTLTSREQECLALRARGLSDAEISATLAIREGTVKDHLKNARAKLRVCTGDGMR